MVGRMYIALFPVILAGIVNMIFVKTSLFRKYARPIDGGKKWIDDRPLLGSHKTWIGFLSMVLFAMILQVIWGVWCRELQIDNLLYTKVSSSVKNDIWLGAALGIIYMVLELPNSFIKRRIGIDAGKTKKNKVGYVFFIVDQIDSIVGLALFLNVMSDINCWDMLLCVLVGGITHISVNAILYLVKIRKDL